MAINDLNSLLRGLIASPVIPIRKLSIGGMLSSTYASIWCINECPVAGAIPTSPQVCTSSLTGALPLPRRVGGQDRVIGKVVMSCSNANGLVIDDRLMHMGGLSSSVTTSQNVGLDLHANLSVGNLAKRIGSPDYSEVEWYVEWYATGGNSPSIPTLNVTFHDGTTGTARILHPAATSDQQLPASNSLGRKFRIIPDEDKYIRSIESITLATSQGTPAGNFGITALKNKLIVSSSQFNQMVIYDWASTGCPIVEDESCLAMSLYATTSTTGQWNGYISLAVN